MLLPDALYVALGPTPRDALLHCVAAGLIDRHQVLGSLAHPSGNGGSQVGYFLREVPVSGLKDRDPVRNRAASLDAAYLELATNTRALGIGPTNAGTEPRDALPPASLLGKP